MKIKTDRVIWTEKEKTNLVKRESLMCTHSLCVHANTEKPWTNSHLCAFTSAPLVPGELHNHGCNHGLLRISSILVYLLGHHQFCCKHVEYLIRCLGKWKIFIFTNTTPHFGKSRCSIGVLSSILAARKLRGSSCLARVRALSLPSPFVRCPGHLLGLLQCLPFKSQLWATACVI